MDNQQLLNRITQQLKPASNVSKTPAGEVAAQADAPQPNVEQKEAINQVFELFRFNYHNQFLKAFPDYDTLIMGKRLWSRLLLEYSGEVIMRAAEKAVKDSKFLPTVHDVVSRCDRANVLGLPDVHAAYMEACRAPSPKKEYPWSHPAVYFAGRASDWFFLANSPESKALPVFQRNYELLLERVQNGEQLDIDLPAALPQHSEVPLPKEEQQRRLQTLKQQL
ncbi:hypothetical protein CHH28_07695 [Bacterioplanes sanyensis]|uniref:Replicative helicase inhibitor G39P N-terminal domain-containing protein n=1 Tax=Bacterioplanes sanyensis TaxID=1249553 RepID=A0A222FJ96_9GAMM|nr:replication protein P [Bacterioplanes sanyensis]ASP38564.1 hypothetical protein CHH28_07695 [Bacterioplanes sanyensis]